MLARQVEHLVVDLVHAHLVARAPVHRERARAQAHHAELARTVGGQALQRAADAGALAVVGGGALGVVQVLLAVGDAAVHHAAHGAQAVFVHALFNAGLAVEVAHHLGVALHVVQ
ncbi:hypothetical protein D9M68_799900 [compost metagenome]